MANRFRIYEEFSKKEYLKKDEEYQKYLRQPVWIINDQVIKDEQEAMKILAQIDQARQQTHASQREMLNQMGGISPDAPLPALEPINMKEMTIDDLVKQKKIMKNIYSYLSLYFYVCIHVYF